MINPLSGTRLYNFNLVCAEPMAFNTDNRFTRDLMFEAVPISSVNILFTKFTCPFGGMTREIIEVPFPRASVKPLINCAWSEACERAIASELRRRPRFCRTRRSVSPGPPKKEREREDVADERENEKRPHHLGAFVAKTHHRRRTTPTPTPKRERENKKKHQRKRKPRSPRRRTFLIFHISMFSSWSSPMDAIFCLFFCVYLLNNNVQNFWEKKWSSFFSLNTQF